MHETAENMTKAPHGVRRSGSEIYAGAVGAFPLRKKGVWEEVEVPCAG